MASKPSGTATFLFTDLENSTRLAREQPKTWEATQGCRDAVLREGMALHHGFVFQVIGGAFCADPGQGPFRYPIKPGCYEMPQLLTR